MIITRPRRPQLRLGYEMNAHPARRLSDLRAALDRFTAPVAARVAGDRPFGIVPHIGEGLSRELASPRVRRELRDELAARGLFPFSVNAFPLQDFHARRVKEQVYLPSWAHHRRADLTSRIAEQLADLLPPGEAATISTLGGAYRPTGHTPGRLRRMATNYLRTVVRLVELERRQGVDITLAAEPEPDTTFEVAEDVTSFLEEHLLPTAAEILPGALGIPRSAVPELLRRKFAVNLDVCHAAVMFRDPVEEWRRLEGAGLRIAKLHLTNALSLRRPAEKPEALAELLGYREPRYLHQTVGRRRDGSLWRGADLGALARAGGSLEELEEVRVHFHVPLSRARLGSLRTTRREAAAALEHALRHSDPPHLVIETYTWPYFTKKAGSRREARQALVDGIVKEFRWVTEEMGL